MAEVLETLELVSTFRFNASSRQAVETVEKKSTEKYSVKTFEKDQTKYEMRDG